MISILTKMVPSSPELSRVLPSHCPDLLSYCWPVGAIVGPGQPRSDQGDQGEDQGEDQGDQGEDQGGASGEDVMWEPFVSNGMIEQSPGRLAEHLYTAPP